jgi:hypothetical protein
LRIANFNAMDRRYRETRDAVDRGAGSQRLIGAYLQRAARDNRRAAVMGGSTGQPDPVEAARRRGITSALRGAERREGNAVFEGSRQEVKNRFGG